MRAPERFLREALDRFEGSLDLCPDRPDDPSTWTGPHQLIRIGAEPGADGIRVDPIESHPSTVLLGYAAPPEVTALGLLSYGWAGGIEHRRPTTDPNAVRVRVLTVVDRQGTVINRVNTAVGDSWCHPPSEGLALECLQRSLGVPTSPPAIDTGPLFAAIWLGLIADESSFRGSSLTWPDAALLHPAVQMLHDPSEQASAAPSLDAGQVLGVAEALTRLLPWSEMRWMAITSGWAELTVAPSLAAWMDDGMFARSILHAYDLDDARSRTAASLSPSGRNGVETVIDAMIDGRSAAA